MDETRQVTLTEENWQKIDYLLRSIPDSNFLRFCLINDMIEEGIELYSKNLFQNQKLLKKKCKNKYKIGERLRYRRRCISPFFSFDLSTEVIISIPLPKQLLFIYFFF